MKLLQFVGHPPAHALDMGSFEFATKLSVFVSTVCGTVLDGQDSTR